MSNNFQSAYKKFHSTESALLRVENDVLLNMEKGRVTALTLLDISAAFDKIDHLTLISHLSSCYGISGTALDWFTSYLSDRCQQVKIQDYISDAVYISFDVPQSSVLRPILFTLYTAPLSHVIAEYDVEHHLYADDTKMYISLSGSEALEFLTDLKSCVTDVFTWMTNSKLNPSKPSLSLSVLKTKEKSSKIYSPWYYLTMTHFLRHSLEIWNSFLIVILTSNNKSRRFAKCLYHIRDFRRIRKYSHFIKKNAEDFSFRFGLPPPPPLNSSEIRRPADDSGFDSRH